VNKLNYKTILNMIFKKAKAVPLYAMKALGEEEV
jgi:hypothetical protein